MMKRGLIAGIILDLDDTLYAERDYFESGMAALAAWISERKREDSTACLERLKTDVRLYGRQGMIDRAVASFDQNSEELRQTLLHVYRTHVPELSPFKDVVPFLSRVRAAGCCIGLVTDGKSCVQWRKLRGLGLEREFDIVVCTDDIDAPKPSPIGFGVVAQFLGILPQQCIYIADDARKDFIGARQIGMSTMQITRPLPWPLAHPAPFPEAEAERRVVSLDEAAGLLFGEGE